MNVIMSVPIEGMPREADFVGPPPTFAEFDPAHPTPAQIREFSDAFTTLRGMQARLFGEQLDPKVFIKDYAKKPEETLGDVSASSVEQGLSA